MQFKKIHKTYSASLDFIGRFENLETDWNYIKTKIDIVDELPHLNKSKHEKYKKYYTNKNLINRVINVYEKDFELYKYDKDLK